MAKTVTKTKETIREFDLGGNLTKETVREITEEWTEEPEHNTRPYPFLEDYTVTVSTAEHTQTSTTDTDWATTTIMG